MHQCSQHRPVLPLEIDLYLWLSREIQERIVGGTVKPELAFINATLVQILSRTLDISGCMCTQAYVCVWKIKVHAAPLTLNVVGNLQIPDILVVKAAAQKALLANVRGSLRSRSMHAELVFSVAGSKHVRHCCFLSFKLSGRQSVLLSISVQKMH